MDYVLNATSFSVARRSNRGDRAKRGLAWNERFSNAESASGLHVKRDPAQHNEHKISANAQSSQCLKQRRVPVEGPIIIYEVDIVSTALARGIDPLGIRSSKKHW
jgi:hypothetical protein